MSNIREFLVERGVESFHGPNLKLPDNSEFEPPCSIKWMQIEHSISMGAFSYAVSGHYFAVRMGRYVSIGESVQIGRHNHPLDWVSTSPFFYLRQEMFTVGRRFPASGEYHDYKPRDDEYSPVRVQLTHIEHDAWIGHGAFIRPGVTIGTGAVVGAHSVVTKDVPPYAVVAGNPAVLKRYRVDEDLIPELLESQWWRFAPWDLRLVRMSDPKTFVQSLAENRAAMSEYATDLVRPNEN